MLKKKLLQDPETHQEEIRRTIRKALSQTVKGEFSAQRDYPVYVTRTRFRESGMPSGLPLLIDHIPAIVLSYAKIADTSLTAEDLLILDLETTGLSRGGGMLAFMVGLGYYEGDTYIVEQLFLPEPESEFNAFDLLLPLLERKAVLVTFNGKSFDLPILESRFLHNQLWLDLRSKPHLDLLHLARRLWKRKVPSCALETLEYYVLGQVRDKELDIEGSDIPQTYFQFLTTGDPELLRRIFVHNQTDVLHTAALFALICQQTDFPLPAEHDIRIDYHALGKLYQSQQKEAEALSILSGLVAEQLITPALVYDLGMLYKKRKAFAEALECFRQGADLLHPPSLHELALLHEQRTKDLDTALQLCETLYQMHSSESLQYARLLADLDKRMDRLNAKLSKSRQANSTPKPQKKRKKDTDPCEK